MLCKNVPIFDMFLFFGGVIIVATPKKDSTIV